MNANRHLKKEIKKPVMNTEEAADYLGASKSALEKSRSSGLLFDLPSPPFIRYGKAIRYRKNSLDKWIDQVPEYKHLAEQKSKCK